LAVAGVRQPLGDEVVAEGDPARGGRAEVLDRLPALDEARARGRQALVRAPGQRTVVDNHVPRADGGDRVEVETAAPGLAGVAGPHAQVAHDHVVGGDVDAAADQGDAGRRRSLAGDGQVRLGDAQRLHAQVDHAADL